MSIQRLIEEVPSEEFFTGFHYTKILPLLGLEPAKPGTFCKCVRCKTESMLVTGLAPFDAWLYCDRCKLSCDAIRLYGHAYKISNPEQLVLTLKDELKLKTVEANDRALYSNFTEVYYERILKIWEHAQANMFPVANPRAVARLNELNLWLNQNIFNKSLRNCIGFDSKYGIEELLQEKIPGIPKAVDSVLVLPFFMKPGFIVGYGFIGQKDMMSYLNVMPEHACGYSGLIDAAAMNTADTYVVPHALQAARIKHKCAVENYNKLSVVAKSPVGVFDPISLPNNTVVWTDDPDTPLLKACITSRGFKVINKDTPYIWNPKEKVSKLWENNLIPSIHAELDLTPQQDPIAFLATELLSMSLGKAKAIADALSLSEFQKNVILSACPPDMKKDMEDLLKQSVVNTPIIMDKKVIFEKDGKIWAQGSRETPDELVSDVILKIGHICRIKHSGNAFLFGNIIYDGKSYGFQANEDDLERDPKDVVSVLLASVGVSKQPYISESIKKKFLDIAIRLHPPEVHIAQDYVGYDKDTNRFNMPRISVSAEQIRVGVPFVISETGENPCMSIEMSDGDSISKLSRIFSYSYETAAYFAAMAGIVSAIYNTIDFKPRTNVLLIGGKGSIAEYMFDLIRMDLGLSDIPLKNKVDVELASMEAGVHHVPVAIDGLRSNSRLLAQWMEGQAKNSLVLADPLYASAMAKDKDWYFIRADAPMQGEPTGLLKSEQLFPFLIQYMLTIRPASAHSFLDSLKYLAKSIGVEESAMDLAKAFVTEQGIINCRTQAAHFMNMLQEGVEAGIFKTFTGDKIRKNIVVTKNPILDIVTVNFTQLLSAMRSNDIPIVCWDAAVLQLLKAGVREEMVDGNITLVFDKPIWNSFVDKIKRMRSLRKASIRNLIGGS
jgi:hypothetical protein